MRNFFLFVTGVFAFSICFCFGDDPAAVVVPDSQFLLELLSSMGSYKGLAGLGLAAVVVQILMKALQTSFAHARFPGAARILAVLGLSLVCGVVGLMATGVPIGAAMLHANTLAAFQVLAHQLYKQLTEKQIS